MLRNMVRFSRGLSSLRQRPAPLMNRILGTLGPARIATASEALPGSAEFHVIEVTKEGVQQRLSLNRDQLMKLPGMNDIMVRDLRVIDSAYQHQLPSILPKKDCVLVNLEFVKAICSADRVLLFDANRPAVRSFADGFSVSLKDTNKLPFELRFLENTLENVCIAFERRCLRLAPVAQTVTDQLSRQVATDSLNRLLPLKNSMTTFEYRVKEAASAVDTLLASDEDMAALFLTQKQSTGVERPIADHEDVELLLETYSRQLEEIMNEISQMKASIASTYEVVSLDLDSNRNSIIRMNLHMTMFSLALSACAVGASAFGMNVPNGFENHPHVFGYLTGGMVFGSIALYAGMSMIARWSRSSYDTASVRDIRALSSLLQDLDDIDDTLRMHLAKYQSLDKHDLTKPQLHQLLCEATGREVSASETDLIFRVFDDNHDGRLNFEDILDASVRKVRLYRRTRSTNGWPRPSAHALHYPRGDA